MTKIDWPLLDNFALWKIRGDAQRWATMLILADAIEEYEPDEIAVANGWRWLAVNHFRPMYIRERRCWFVYRPSYENLDAAPKDGTIPSRAFYWLDHLPFQNESAVDHFSEYASYKSRYDAEMEVCEAVALAKIKPNKWKCPRRYTTANVLKYELY